MFYGEKKRFLFSIVIITFLLFYILYNKTYSSKSLIEKLIFTSWCFQMIHKRFKSCIFQLSKINTR